jgi:hypothetical protein
MAINSKEKQKDSHLQCYNWQFLNSLSVWGHLLQHAAADQEDPMHALHPLIYPFTQVRSCVSVCVCVCMDMRVLVRLTHTTHCPPHTLTHRCAWACWGSTATSSSSR